MKKKRLAALLMAGAMALSMTACGGGNNGGAAAGSGAAASGGSSSEGGNYAIVVKSLADQYWVLLKAGAESKAKELGVKVEVTGPNAESEVQQQADMIQNQIGKGVDGLAVAPSSPDTVLTVLAQADSAGIPVVAVDTDLPKYENKKSFIGTGNEAAGQQGGEYAAQLVGSGKKAIVLRGRQGDTTHDQREAGIVAGLKAGGVEILEVKACDSEAEKAMNAVMDMMNRYPEIDIVVTTADSMAQGAQRAIEQAGRDIPVLGFDGTIPVAEMTAEGKFMGTVAQDPYNMGVVGVEEAVKAAKGEKIETRIDTGAKMVTQDNAAEFVADLKAKMGE